MLSSAKDRLGFHYILYLSEKAEVIIDVSVCKSQMSHFLCIEPGLKVSTSVVQRDSAVAWAYFNNLCRHPIRIGHGLRPFSVLNWTAGSRGLSWRLGRGEGSRWRFNSHGVNTESHFTAPFGHFSWNVGVIVFYLALILIWVVTLLYELAYNRVNIFLFFFPICSSFHLWHKPLDCFFFF